MDSRRGDMGGPGPQGDVRDLGRRYVDALRAGSARAAAEVIDEAVRMSVGPGHIHDEIIRPALVTVGDLWSGGELTVADEHLATGIAERSLVHLLDPLRISPSARREKVLLAAPEGERHVVGLRMIADVLDGAGFDVLYLGQDVPCAALRAAVGSHRPAVAGLTCTCSGPMLVRAVGAIMRSDSPPRILLGGEGVPGCLRDGGYSWLNSSSGVGDFVQKMLENPPGPPPSRLATSRHRTRRTGVLTPRQRDVLAGLADGKSTKQIAAELVVAQVTVRNHVANILAALGAHSRLEAVATARRLGVIN